MGVTGGRGTAGAGPGRDLLYGLSMQTAPSPWGRVDPSQSVWLFLSLKKLVLFGISRFCLAAPQLPTCLLSSCDISTCPCVCACVCCVVRFVVLGLSIWIILKCYSG